MNNVRLVYENGVPNIQKKLWYVDNSSEINLNNFEAGDRIYSINDNKLYQIEYDSSTEQEYSGEIVSFEADEDDRISSLEVEINPVQDLHGYDNPWLAGGGKNKLPTIGANGPFQNMTISYDQAEEIYTLNGLLTSPGNIPLADIPSNNLNWVEGEYYTLSCKVVSGSFTLGEGSGITYALSLFSADSSRYIRGETSKTESQLDGYSGTGTAFISDTYYLMLQCWRVGTVFNNLKIKIQIEKGTTATAWTPYSNICPISGHTGLTVYHSGADTSDPTTIPISWQTEAGTVYGGTLDVMSGKMLVTHAIVDLGTLGWGYSANDTRFYSQSLADEKSILTTVLPDSKCSAYKVITFDQFYNNPSVNGTISIYYNAYLFVRDLRFTSSVDFKNAISGVMFVYELAEPVEYTLSANELTILYGQNNVWTDVGEINIKVIKNDMTAFELKPHI